MNLRTVLLALAAAAAAVHAQGASKLSPAVTEKLQKDGKVTVIVEFSGNKEALKNVASVESVSSIDTGVRYTHEALKGNWVGGSYGWYDPYKGQATPYDDHGHGTHTMGTIAGSKGIGVAPGAKWMACKGCDPSGCTEDALTK